MKAIWTQWRHTSTQHNNHLRQSTAVDFACVIARNSACFAHRVRTESDRVFACGMGIRRWRIGSELRSLCANDCQLPLFPASSERVTALPSSLYRRNANEPYKPTTMAYMIKPIANQAAQSLFGLG